MIAASVAVPDDGVLIRVHASSVNQLAIEVS